MKFDEVFTTYIFKPTILYCTEYSSSSILIPILGTLVLYKIIVKIFDQDQKN